MSHPFGMPNERPLDAEHAAILRAFDELVHEYARTRLLQDQLSAEVAASDGPAANDLRQRLADASQEGFMVTRRVVAFAMVLAGDEVFTRCANIITNNAAERSA